MNTKSLLFLATTLFFALNPMESRAIDIVNGDELTHEVIVVTSASSSRVVVPAGSLVRSFCETCALFLTTGPDDGEIIQVGEEQVAFIINSEIILFRNFQPKGVEILETRIYGLPGQ